MDSASDKTANGTPLPDPARVAAARLALICEGHTVRSWAKHHGEQVALVYKVLTGNRPCVMGASRRIAEKLNIVGDPAAHPYPLPTPALPSPGAGAVVEAGAPIDHFDRGAEMKRSAQA